jgi:hypothetical protein
VNGDKRDRLAALASDCGERVEHPPSWDEVADRCARLQLASALDDAVVTAGLASDATDMAVQDHWPTDVQAALKRLGLFEKYSPTSAHGVLAHLSGLQRAGLENAVKGTDFEIQSVGRIDHGQVPGLTGRVDSARLAGSTNQPGWDATAYEHHRAVLRLQMKATDNWHVLAEHLSRYPGYPDLVTTQEAAQQAAAHGLDAGHVFDSGISNTGLTREVDASLGHLDWVHGVHEVFPEAAFVAIAAMAIKKRRAGANVREVAAWVREQAAIAGIANIAGLLVQVATGLVALRPPTSIATRFVAARGKLADQVAARMRTRRHSLRALVRLSTPFRPQTP